jgi:hypothetical protein
LLPQCGQNSSFGRCLTLAQAARRCLRCGQRMLRPIRADDHAALAELSPPGCARRIRHAGTGLRRRGAWWPPAAAPSSRLVSGSYVTSPALRDRLLSVRGSRNKREISCARAGELQ